MSLYFMLKREVWINDIGEFMKDITPFSPNIKQQELLDLVKKLTKRILICSANKTGKTLLLAIIALWFCTVYAKKKRRRVRVLLVSGSWTQAKKLQSFVKEFIEHPYIEELIKGDPKVTELNFKDGSWIKSFTSSEKQILGEHPNVYFGDEAVLIPDNIMDDSYSRIVGEPGIIIFTSTPETEYYFSRFIEMWNDLKKYEHWERKSWSSFDCNWISLSEIKEAEATLSKDKFDAKWKGEPSFNPKGALFNPVRLRDEVKVKTCSFDTNSPSYMGVDFGSKNPTIITIFQKEGSTWYLVYAEEWTEKPRDFIINRIGHLIRDYNVMIVNADAAIPWLIRDLQDLRLCKIKGITFKGNKPRMQFGLQSLIEHKDIKIPEKYKTAFMQLSVYTIDTHEKDDWVDSIMLGVQESSLPPSTWYIRVGSKRKRKSKFLKL